MKIDLHNHTSERSACGKSREEEQIAAAISYGLNAMVITDHDVLMPDGHLEELNEKFAPFIIFSGIEISIKEHPVEHILVLGVHDKLLQEKRWSYGELHTFVKERGGYIGLAHPYRYYDEVKIDIEHYVPDGIEVHSTNIGAADVPQIKALARRLGSRLLANSDSHTAKHMGMFYNELCQDVSTEDELIRELKLGNYILGVDKERVSAYNVAVRVREERIKEMISEGKTEADYAAETGQWTGLFNRVARGKSYEI